MKFQYTVFYLSACGFSWSNCALSNFSLPDGLYVVAAVEEHIEYMLSALPEWLTRVIVKSGRYLKINRQTELSSLNDQISKLSKDKQLVVPT